MKQKKCVICDINLPSQNRSELCLKHYQSQYIKKRWRENSKYRKEQIKRIHKWRDNNLERWKEIQKKARETQINKLKQKENLCQTQKH